MSSSADRVPRQGQQRGAVLMALMIMVIIAIAAGLVAAGHSAAQTQAQERGTREVLAQARQALLGWSATRGDSGVANARPGELPCPDFNDDGLAEAACGAGQMGRLPWRSLGLPPLTDAAGERLWYAVGAGFRSVGQDNGAINSDRTGPLQLFDNTGAALAAGADGLAAVLIAPGSPLTGQARPSNAPTDYVEAALGVDNRIAGGPYITGPIKTAGIVSLNDVITGISAREVIQMAERRALTEARNALTAFAAANAGRFPNAADAADATCLTPIANVTAPGAPCGPTAGRCYGRLPESPLAAYTAGWFQANGWGRVFSFAVRSDIAVDASGADCSAALTVDGAASRAVLLAPGTPRAGQLRPSALLPNYLDDATNDDAWSGGAGRSAFTRPAAGNDILLNLP